LPKFAISLAYILQKVPFIPIEPCSLGKVEALDALFSPQFLTIVRRNAVLTAAAGVLRTNLWFAGVYYKGELTSRAVRAVERMGSRPPEISYAYGIGAAMEA
jgi:hypothetical protein